ncbi:hypothetical protein KPL35_16535 [Clostridium sp. CF011]|uniref:hypothetical protein n=1 Tax=Clostridium sp. CF011 TaxID=2843318 RepID=UPI001C0C557D|nr:hypothetical protein [Clostridium sp. CF011]MBU3093664.1 hypothetical protein [Clostridium sp. CF011]WAG70679.1 hypothetical protein LL036_04365 [Clostridium sp. CF011]
MNNKNKNANVSSSTSGATLQSSKESTGFKVGSVKVLSNEQSYASKDDPSTDMSTMTNNIKFSTPEDVKEFNERSEAIIAAGKK